MPKPTLLEQTKELVDLLNQTKTLNELQKKALYYGQLFVANSGNVPENLRKLVTGLLVSIRLNNELAQLQKTISEQQKNNLEFETRYLDHDVNEANLKKLKEAQQLSKQVDLNKLNEILPQLDKNSATALMGLIENIASTTSIPDVPQSNTRVGTGKRGGRTRQLVNRDFELPQKSDIETDLDLVDEPLELSEINSTDNVDLKLETQSIDNNETSANNSSDVDLVKTDTDTDDLNNADTDVDLSQHADLLNKPIEDMTDSELAMLDLLTNPVSENPNS